MQQSSVPAPKAQTEKALLNICRWSNQRTGVNGLRAFDERISPGPAHTVRANDATEFHSVQRAAKMNFTQRLRRILRGVECACSPRIERLNRCAPKTPEGFCPPEPPPKMRHSAD